MDSTKNNEENNQNIELKSRRGLPVHRTNPSVERAIEKMKTGYKKITNENTGDEMLIANTRTGEVLTNASVAFTQNIKVDRTEFVKLYIDGVSSFVGLKSGASKVFEMIMLEANKNIGKDILFLSPRIAIENYGISRSVFMTGIKDLLLKEIIYEHIEVNCYFININYFFNGDRLAFLKTYEIEKELKEVLEEEAKIQRNSLLEKLKEREEAEKEDAEELERLKEENK